MKNGAEMKRGCK